MRPFASIRGSIVKANGVCERRKRASEALAYNGLVQSWPELVRLAQESGKAKVATPTEQELEL